VFACVVCIFVCLLVDLLDIAIVRPEVPDMPPEG
jgi:hypothetical protein